MEMLRANVTLCQWREAEIERTSSGRLPFANSQLWDIHDTVRAIEEGYWDTGVTNVEGPVNAGAVLRAIWFISAVILWLSAGPVRTAGLWLDAVCLPGRG